MVPTFRGTADTDAAVTIAANGVTLGTTIANSSGRWQFTVPAPLTEDSYFVSATGNGPARFDLTAPLDVGDSPVAGLGGLTLRDDRISFYPFGEDENGVLNVDDVIVTAAAARLALPTNAIVASSVVQSFKRSYCGQLLLDQQFPADPIPNYSLINENLVSEFGLASVLPIGIRRFEVRNVDTSNGFSAEFYALGAFGDIDLAEPAPPREQESRAAIRQHIQDALGSNVEPDPLVIAVSLDRWAGYELVPTAAPDAGSGEGESTGGSFTIVELDDGAIQELRDLGITTAADLNKAEQAIAEAFRFEAEVELRAVRSQFEADDLRGQKFAELLQQRDDAAQRIVQQAITVANSIENPTEKDFEFVEAIFSFTALVETYALGVDSIETLIQLRPSIDHEITRLQFEAVSQAEISLAVNQAIVSADAVGEDSVEATLDTTKQFMDTFIARVQVDAANQQPPATTAGLSATALQLANTAVALAVNLVNISNDFSADDPTHGPDALVNRIRQLVSDYAFDQTNLLPEKRLPPVPPPPADDPRAFVLLGDLPLDINGKLTTDSVTDLLQNVPAGVSRFIPLDTEFEFSFKIDNGAITPLNLPTLTVGFDNLKLGKSFVAAGFISLGSYAENGDFQKGTFAGGLDIAGDIDGFNASLGVTINGTGQDRGFFPDDDGAGGTIVATAIVDLDFKTPSDLPGFFLEIKDAAATFDMRMRIDDLRGFTFEQFGLSEITVDSFRAAFGGTAPPENAPSPIPTDAFVALSSSNVIVNFADNEQPLLSFGTITAQLPAAPGGLGDLIASVRGFGIDVNDGGLDLALANDFGFAFSGANTLLKQLGVPDFINVDSLAFQAGDNFLDAAGNPNELLDFTLLVSGGIDLDQLDPVPARADIRGLSIDVGALAQGDLFEAFEIQQGISASIGPIDFGGVLTLSGGVGIEKIEYDLPGGGTDSSLLLMINGLVDIPGVAGIGADLVISELGPIAFGLQANTEIPIGATGVSIKSLGGRVVLNAPDIRDIVTPLDLFAESSDPGVVDFTDLAGPLTAAQLRGRTKTLLEANALQLSDTGTRIETWLEPLLFAIDVDLGIAGDPTNTLLVETTVGARIDPTANETDLKIFGLGSLTVRPGQEGELKLGDAAVLLALDGDDTEFSVAFRAGGNGDASLNIPAQLAVGAKFSKRGELFQLDIEGQVTLDGFTGSDANGTPVSAQAGGVLIIEPSVGLYGAVQITVGVNQPGDDLYLEGDLFVRFNTDSDPQQIDPAVAQVLVPKLIDTTTGQAIIPPGFGLFATVQLGLGDVVSASGTLEIESDPSGLRAALILDGNLFNGVVVVGLDGEMFFASVDGELKFRNLNVDASIEIIVIDGFLEIRGDGNLAIDQDGLQNLSASSSGIFLGIGFGPNTVAVDKHRCISLSGDGCPIEFPLPGGECGVSEGPVPTRINIPPATFNERDTGERSVDIRVDFEGPNQIFVPNGIDPEIILEYWVVSRPDDTAQGLENSGDYRRLERASVAVVGTNPVAVPGGRLFQLPSTVSLPVDLFGDFQIEIDETFSIFVQPVIPPGVQHPILLRGDGFGRITIENDDLEILPPSDAVVFFDFDLLEQLPGPGGSVIPQWAFEPGPDVSRPDFTFDLSAVSEITHTFENLVSPPRSGLPRLEDVSRAAFAETWARAAVSDLADPDLNGGGPLAIPGDPPVTFSDVEIQREWFEFTITPASTTVDQVTTGLRVDGIDFYELADIGGTDWEIRYSLDDFESILQSAPTHSGTFGRNRFDFQYPPGRSANFPSDVPITFRISGPQDRIATLEGNPLPWRVDNLALYGGRYDIVSGPTQVVVVTQVEVVDLGNTRTTDNSTIVEIDTTGQTMTRTNTDQRDAAVGRGLPRGVSAAGFVSGGDIFFGANANGIADFLDLNGNQTQEAGELVEPIAVTDASGRFEILIDAGFDQNNDGVIDPDEGLLVSLGGFDQGTDLELPLRFKAPVGSLALTPLTTVLTSLVTEQSLDFDQAHDLVRGGLTVAAQALPADANLFVANAIEQINGGDATAIPEYLAILQIHDTARLFAESLRSPSLSLADAGDFVFASIASELLQ